MALRFRRRVRLMPGVHLNFSSGGVSVSAGVRGASITAGKRGIYSNTSIPGTGLSSRRRLDAPPRQQNTLTGPREADDFDVRLRLQDTGEVTIEGDDGAALSARQLKLLRDKKGEIVRQWLEEAVGRLNADYEACMSVHLLTPSPSARTGLVINRKLEPEPKLPPLQQVRVLDRLLLRRKAIEQRNRALDDRFRSEWAAWEAGTRRAMTLFESANLLSKAAGEGNPKAMEFVLCRRLEALPWPRETSASFDFGSDASSLDLDIDLAEIEDMPRRIAEVAGRGVKVVFKDRTDAQVRRDYLRLVNGTIFRVIGEAFACLPTVEVVTASGFTQRTNPATGQTHDDYVISARVERAAWQEIDFGRLALIDPGDALSRFDLSQSVDRSGNLRSVAPLNATA